MRKERLVTINNNKILDDMSSDSDEMEDVTSLTSHTTPVKIFKSPSSGRPKPVFLPEPKSFSTKKVRTLVIYYFLDIKRRARMAIIITFFRNVDLCLFNRLRNRRPKLVLQCLEYLREGLN